MRQFCDSKGRPWTLSVTVGTIKRVKALVGVDLLDLTAGDPPLCNRIATDIMLVCDVAYALVKPVADSMSPPVTDEEFGESLGGDAIAKCHEALQEEIADFFRQSGRTEMAGMIEGAKRLTTAAIREATQRVQAVDVDKIISTISNEQSTSSPG